MILVVAVLLLCAQRACPWALPLASKSSSTASLRFASHLKPNRIVPRRSRSLSMVIDGSQALELGQQWMHLVYHGLADASLDTSATVTTAVDTVQQAICPGFGEPGWAPFCFLNGNPVFGAFDNFQAFIQSSVVQLHDFLYARGIQQAYGPSIILFTVFIRLILFPLNYKQIASTQMLQALNPKVNEIRERFPEDKNMQNQLVALLYEEAKANPLSGCLPAIIQIPVFLSLYRSFQNLAATQQLTEPFLWIPDLEGPTFGARSSDWLLSNWHDYTPSLGWHDTLAYATIPVLLYVAQALSLKILTPPSDDPQVQKSQAILKYLPLMLSYFSLSVPAGLGVYWIINNLLSTFSTLAIKQYFKANPIQVSDSYLQTSSCSQLTYIFV